MKQALINSFQHQLTEIERTGSVWTETMPGKWCKTYDSEIVNRVKATIKTQIEVLSGE